MGLSQVAREIFAAPARRAIHLSLDPPPREDDERLRPGEAGGYFEIRLSEMSLEHSRKLWVDRSPALLAVASYTYDGERRTESAVIGSESLAKVDRRWSEAGTVERQNLSLFGPVPFVGDDVELAIGLFAVPEGDMVGTVLAVMERVSDEVGGGGALASRLSLLDVVNDGVKRLLGLDDLQGSICLHRGFGGGAEPNRFRRCYLASIDQESSSPLSSRLSVRDGRLMATDANGEETAFAGKDFCLVEVDRRTDRGGYTSLPFHQRWTEVSRLLGKGRLDDAKALMLQLNSELAASPDVTREDRIDLLTRYTAHFESEREALDRLERALNGATRGSGTRGGGDGEAGLAGLVSRAHALKRNGTAGLADPLLALGRRWAEFNGLEASEEEFRVETELAFLRDARGEACPEPEEYARALNRAELGVA